MATQKKIIVIGSIAYDHVMQYAGRFEDAIMPGNFNFALSTHDRAVFFGGCGGNIAYSLKLFGQHPIIMTAVGKDFDAYKDWLASIGIETPHIYVTDKFMTASAFIVTDQDENQVTLFDPGAMHGVDTTQTLREAGGVESVAWVMIAPDKPSTMVKFAKEAKELGIPYIFDPAQQLSIFKPEDLMRAIQGAHILIVNEYESELLSHMLALSKEEISSMVPIYIETHGAKGCHVKEQKIEHYVRSVQPSRLVDPTGAGDAFRAGVLAGLVRGYNIERSCQMGALLATYNLECRGSQCHSFTLREFSQRFENNFGQPLQEMVE